MLAHVSTTSSQLVSGTCGTLAPERRSCHAVCAAGGTVVRTNSTGWSAMRLETPLECSGTTHTLVVDGGLVLIDHQTEPEQVFDALRGGADEGCLLIRKAWDGVTRSDAEREFLHALLVED